MSKPRSASSDTRRGAESDWATPGGIGSSSVCGRETFCFPDMRLNCRIRFYLEQGHLLAGRYQEQLPPGPLLEHPLLAQSACDVAGFARIQHYRRRLRL